MKKLSAVLVALLPVLYILLMQAANWFHLDDGPFLASLGIYTILGLLLPIIFDTLTVKSDKSFLARNNIWFYAVNLALFITEIVLLCIRLEENRIAEQNGDMEGGLGIVLLILVYLPHWFSYLFTRIAGAICCARTLREACVPGTVAFHVFLQLFPGTDLISSLWVAHKVRQKVIT